ncbi:MAG: hypothetical protein Q4F65_14475, partial [Propionibacteriaceae bacterium]|nr:hypothetical protein [Propionibacteriaceae bacterium]
MAQARLTSWVAATAVAGMALGLGGCAVTVAAEPPPAPATQAASTAAALRALDISEVAHIIPADSPDALASSADAVVTGTVRSWLAGDKVTTESGASVGAAILAEVEVERVHAASAQGQPAPGEVIYLTFVTGPMDSEPLVASLPTGLSVAAFLEGPLTGSQLAINEELRVEAGDSRAAGKPRWIPEPQGFVVVDPDDP